MEVESRWGCPACGARRLAIEELPSIGALGAQPLSDIVGMGDPNIHALPEIVCLNCGRRWPDVAAYWAEAGSTGASGGGPGSSAADPEDAA